MLSVVLFSYNLLIYTVDILIDQSPIPPLTLNAKYLLLFFIFFFYLFAWLLLVYICAMLAGLFVCFKPLFPLAPVSTPSQTVKNLLMNQVHSQRDGMQKTLVSMAEKQIYQLLALFIPPMHVVNHKNGENYSPVKIKSKQRDSKCKSCQRFLFF